MIILISIKCSGYWFLPYRNEIIWCGKFRNEHQNIASQPSKTVENSTEILENPAEEYSADYVIVNGKKIYNEEEAIGLLPIAHAAVIAAEPVEKKLRNLTRKGKLVQPSPALRLQEALDNGDISQAEFDQVTRARQLKRNVIMVDDFDMMLSQHDEKLLERHVF